MRDDQDVTDRFLTAWWGVFRNQRVTVKQVIITAIEGDAVTKDLRAALNEVAPSDYPGTFSPHKLGRWLVRHDRQTNFYSDNTIHRLTARGADNHQQVWQLVPEPVQHQDAQDLSAVA